MRKFGLSVLALSSLFLTACQSTNTPSSATTETTEEKEYADVRTVYSKDAYAKEASDDTAYPDEYFVYETNIPAYTGTTVNLTDYVAFVSNTALDTSFDVYVLSDGSTSLPVVTQSGTSLTFVRADTVYVNVENGTNFATLEIHVQQSYVNKLITDYYSSLGTQYMALSYTGTNYTFRDDDYYYSTQLDGGYLYSEIDDSTYTYRISSITGTDLEVNLPSEGDKEAYDDLIGNLDNITAENLLLTGDYTVSGINFPYGIYGDSDLISPLFTTFGFTESSYTVSGSTTVYPYGILFTSPTDASGSLACFLMYDASYNVYPVEIMSIQSNSLSVDALETYMESTTRPVAYSQTEAFLNFVSTICETPNYTISGDYTLTDNVTGESIKTGSDTEFMYFGAKDMKITENAYISSYYSSVTVDGVKYYRPGGLVTNPENLYNYTYRATLDDDGIPVADSYAVTSTTVTSSYRNRHWYEVSSYTRYLLTNTFDKYFFRGLAVEDVDGAMKITPYTDEGLEAIEAIISYFTYYNYFFTVSEEDILATLHPYVLISYTTQSISVDINFIIHPDIGSFINLGTGYFKNETTLNVHIDVTDIGTTTIAGIDELIASL